MRRIIGFRVGTLLATPHAAVAMVVSLTATLLFATSAAIAASEGTHAATREHYVPRAGYLRTVDLLAFRRSLSLRLATAAPGQVTSLTGHRAVPTLLIEFSNKAGQFTAAQYQDHLFGNVPSIPPRPTISQYYRDMSLGQFEVRGVVLGWFRLPNDDDHYSTGDFTDLTGFGEFLRSGLDEADAVVDFGEFDNDGPDGLPNSGDDDGIVDTVFFVHPESGAECGTPETAGNIWSHLWNYSNASLGHSAAYETNDVQLNDVQVPVLNDDGTEKRILIEDYTVQPGLACPNSSGNPVIVPIGVYAHEYGHALGLPDLYDRTPGSNADSNGIGTWGLMAGGSWGFEKRNPAMPTRMSAWSLARLGWANLELLDPGTPASLTLEPVQQRNRVHVIDVPGSNGIEYFLLELKDNDWDDPAGLRLNWDAELPEAGLAIWHIDDSVGSASPDWPFAPLDQGQNDARSMPGESKHSIVSLEQADCLLNLETKNNSGDDDDLWESGTVFGTAGCNGGSMAYDGTATGITIENIDISQLTANLNLQGTTPQPPSAPVLVDATVEDAEDSEVAGGPAFAGAPPAAAMTRTTAVRPAVRREYSAVMDRSATRLSARNASLENINTSLKSEESVDELTAEQKSALMRSSTAEIEYGVDLAQQKQVKAWVAKQRQYEVRADYTPQTELQTSLKGLWEASGADNPIRAQMDSTETRIDRVTGLNVPSEHETLAADADERLDSTVQPLVGEDVLLQKVQSKPNANAQQFQQVYAVDGVELPVFSSGVTLHYDDQKTLKAIAARTVDTDDLNITGAAGQLDKASAMEAVVQQLGLPAERAAMLQDTGEGIYLVDKDPSQARVTRRTVLPGSGMRPAIVIYVDAETRTVVGVE